MGEQLKRVNWTSIIIQIAVILFAAGLAYGKIGHIEIELAAKVDKEVFDAVVLRIDENVADIKEMLKDKK